MTNKVSSATIFSLLILLTWIESSDVSNAQSIAHMPKTDNAALLYYRAAWAERLSWEKRNALDHGEIDPATSQYFLVHQDALDLIEEAGFKPKCDWGVEDIGESAFGIVGVMSRVSKILTDLPLDYFRYHCATSNQVTSHEIVAVLNLAKHLEQQRSLAIVLLTRGSIVSKALLVASQGLGKMNGEALAELNDFLREHRSVVAFQVSEALLTDISIMEERIDQLLETSPAPAKDEKLVKFLLELGVNGRAKWVSEKETGRAVLITLKEDLLWLKTVVDIYNTWDRDVLEKRIEGLKDQLIQHPSCEPRIKTFSSLWERLFATTQKVELFRLGISLTLNKQIQAEKPEVPKGIDFERKEDGFILRKPNITALTRPVELKFGGFGKSN